MASTYLTRSNGTPTSQQIFTFSAWVKRSGLNPSGNNMELFSQYNDTSNRMDFRFQTGDTIDFYHTSSLGRITTNRLFRDTSAWYHIVLRVDTTQATSSDRYRLYINGVQETSFSTATYPSQNANLGTNFSTFSIGDDSYGSGDFDGCMTHIHYTDGQSYDATAFGETDATTGEWKIKTSPSVTYGNNGFFILKDGNSVTDQSGNGNNFTASGTLTNTEDCPSNVFCVLNPLSHLKGWTTTDGNTTFNSGTVTDWSSAVAGTIGASTGKYYWEVKFTSGDAYSILGVLPLDQYWRCNKGSTTENVYNYAQNIQFDTSGSGSLRNYVSSNTTFPQVSLNDIFSFAMDMDNRKCWIGVNGVWYNSGNPATGTNPTWDTTEFNSDWDGGFVPFTQGYYISNSTEFKFNFGNGYFGTTAVASAGTNASGIGIFEYDVPTGYTALSTKGLNL